MYVKITPDGKRETSTQTTNFLGSNSSFLGLWKPQSWIDLAPRKVDPPKRKSKLPAIIFFVKLRERISYLFWALIYDGLCRRAVFEFLFITFCSGKLQKTQIRYAWKSLQVWLSSFVIAFSACFIFTYSSLDLGNSFSFVFPRTFNKSKNILASVSHFRGEITPVTH